MRFAAWLFGGLLLIAAGWVGGPVAVASYRVATAADPNIARLQVARDLVDVSQRPVADGFRLNLTLDFTRHHAAIKACGYDPEKLLTEEGVPYLRSTDWGVDVLQQRAADDFATITQGERVMHLTKHHSTALMTVLTECLGTPLAALCRGQVDRIIAAADSANAKEVAETQAFSREQDQAILCTYLDGAAARRGIAKTTTAPKPAP